MGEFCKTILVLAGLCTSIIASASQTAFGKTSSPQPLIDSGPVPMNISANQLLTINVKLNDSDVPAIMDTGSSTVLVDRQFAEQQGLRTASPISGYAYGGQLSIRLVSGGKLQIGRAVLPDAQMAVGSLAPVNATKGTNFRALIGMSAMRAGSLDFDFRQMKFRTSSGHLPVVSGSRSYPLTVSGGIVGIPVLTTTLGGQTVKAAIDTGKDSDLFVSEAVFERLLANGGGQTTIAKLGLGGISISRAFSMASLDVAGLTAQNIVIEEEKSGGLMTNMGVDVVIGLRVLRQFNMNFDFVAHKAFLSPSGVIPPAPKKSTSGLQWAHAPKFAHVVHVMANSPAARAGWAAGDRVCQIDGKSIQEVRSSSTGWIDDSPGRKATFTLCTGATRELEFKAFY